MTALGFIGAGNMGFALIKGFQNWVSASDKLRKIKLHVYDALPEKREELTNLKFSVLGSEIEIAKSCKYIVFACKPQQLSELLGKIKPHLTQDSVLISLCAGISAEFICKRTSADAKVVLVMPNMPMLLGEGASAIARNEAVSGKEFDFARSVIESCGTAEVVPLDKMNEIICINASSPAFIYLFSKCFTDYAAEQGIDEKVALNLFAKTLTGASKMLTESGFGIDELIAQVSSKGGTTLAGLEALRSGGFEQIVKNACEACTKRAHELGG
ncbi:MAG: pyrroline-5-carboxylate reductase [Oscillospiraceae bacterium]|jgi:pyrroline-5-carboxylate reductase|nr:pyrroline-5-carboxylate reductase [Oscillospiraceae bacterium]